MKMVRDFKVKKIFFLQVTGHFDKNHKGGPRQPEEKKFFDFEIPHHFRVKLKYINMFIKKKFRNSSKITHEFILAHPVFYVELW